jgi:uncharacterized membrane protein YjdF
MESESVSTEVRLDKIGPAIEPPKAKKISGIEVAFAAIGALLIFTALLLKLPYRSPVRNSLLTALTLSAFYFYLRLRLNLRFPMRLILFLIFCVVIDIIGNQFGLFSRRIWFIPYDIITHFLSTALSFIPVMWLLKTIIKRYGYRLPLGFIAFFAATTTFSLAAYYEITELMDERLFGGHRIWTPRDTSQDLTSDLIGIIVAAIIYTLAIRKRWYVQNPDFRQEDDR